jgi:phage/plasmid-like protein (TIGR03299 family)
MAHELTIRADGRAEFAYTGAAAWHGLGQELHAGATIEEWRAAAGMDWNIRRSVARFFADEDQRADCFELCEVPGETVLFRSDTRAPLGIVSPDYEIVQPAQVLEFFRDLVAQHGMTLESAGTLFGGRRFFALAKLGEQTIVGADRVGGYLLLCTSADGTMATEARQTTVRVVCNNTLRLARSEAGGAVAPVKLNHRQAFCDKRIKDQLGLSRDNFARGIAHAQELARIKVSNLAAADFVRRLLRPTEAARDAASVAAAAIAQAAASAPAKPQRAPRGEAAILELFASSAMGGTLAGAQGTAWGLVNAVTEYVDHHATARSADHRRSSAWFGDGDALKLRALELAPSLA